MSNDEPLFYKDPELAAMQMIVEYVEPLHPSAQQRVIGWAYDRWGQSADVEE